MESQPVTFSYGTVGLDCPRRAEGVRDAIAAIRGVEQVSLSPVTGRLVLVLATDADEAACKRETLSTIRAAGGDLVLPEGEDAEIGSPRPWMAENAESILTAVAGITLFLGLAVGMLIGNSSLATPAYLVSAVAGMASLAKPTIAFARMGHPDMGLLAILATTGSLAIGFAGDAAAFLSAALVAFLCQVTKWIGAWAMRRASDVVAEPLDELPPLAHLVEGDGGITNVATEDVPAGELVRVLPGEAIPLDGTVEAGSASVDESLVAGGRMPIGRGIGDEVMAGTTCMSGTIDIRVSAGTGDSAIEQAVSQALEAHEHEIPYADVAARIASAYVPFVLAAAVLLGIWLPLHMSLTAREVLAGAWHDWACRAVALLVTACPGALVLAAPVTFVSSMSHAYRRGVFVRDARTMAAASLMTVACVDKTGTLTAGRPEVTHVVPLDGTDGTSLLSTAAALEARISHPLARAVCEYAEDRGIPPAHADDVSVTAGNGVSGTVGGRSFRIGRVEAMLEETDFGGDEDAVASVRSKADALRGASLTVLAISDGKSVVGLLGVSDKPRPSAAPTVSGLRSARSGRLRVEMLTGDRGGAVERVAAAAGVDKVVAGLTPEGKSAHVRNLADSGEVVMAVGDASCDAPVLEAASIGVALGVRPLVAAPLGADVAMASGSLGKVAWLVRESVWATRVSRAGIAVAVAAKATLAGLALAGIVGAGEAAVAEAGVTLAVALVGLWPLRDSRRQ